MPIWDCFTNHTQVTPYAGSPSSAGTCGDANAPVSTGVVYYWRVRGIDGPLISSANGFVLGLWSNTGNADTFRFLRDPPMPSYIAPADGASVATPALSWQLVPGAETYLVTIRKANSLIVPGYPKTTYATSYTPTGPLTATDGPFAWYVQAVDGDGVASAIPAQGAWRTFTLADPVTGPLTQLTPADGASSARSPAMSWVPYAGASKYVVHYFANGFELMPPLASGVPYAGFTYEDVPLAPGTYQWSVEAQNSAGAFLATSGQRSFTVVPLGVIPAEDYLSPVRCAALSSCASERDTPTLTWSPVQEAGFYVVTIANDPHFTNVVRTYVTAYPTLTPRESLVDNQAGQAYYWFVRPCLDNQTVRCGPGPDDDTANPNASAFHKSSNAVTLVAPADGTTVENLATFSWTDYLATNGASAPSATQEAKQYTIQVSTARHFSTILDTATVDELAYTPFGLTYPEGPLYWRVQAIDGSGNHLTWSAIRLVTKRSPEPA